MGEIVAVCSSPIHSFSKLPREAIRLIAGLGVEGDAHIGQTIQHRSRVAVDPAQPNLRQVHLIPAELIDELRAAGFGIEAGQMGENVTTRGIDLLALPVGSLLQLGAQAVVEVTGLRNPCVQLNAFQSGLMEAVVERDGNGRLIGKAGIMGIALLGGVVRPGDAIEVELPPLPHRRLGRV
jgi:MOSC domain-containing protein YiiM